MLYLVFSIFVLFSMDLIGYAFITKKKYLSTVSGFLLINALNFPFALLMKFLDCSFNLYTILLSVILLTLLVFSIKNYFKEWIRNFYSYNIVVYLIIFVISLVMSLMVNNLSDSWLYLKLIMYPCVTNSIEVQEMGYTHSYDTFYLLQSYFTKVSGLDSYTFILFSLTYINSFIVMLTSLYIFESLLSILNIPMEKIKSYLVIPLFVYLFNFYYLSPVYFKNSVIFFTINVVSSGTLFLYALTIPFLMLSLLFKVDRKVLSLVIIASFSFSYSFIYLYFVFFLIYVIKIFIFKQNTDLKFYTLFLNVIPLCIYLNLNISITIFLIMQTICIMVYVYCERMVFASLLVPIGIILFNIFYINFNYGIWNFIEVLFSSDRNEYISGSVAFVYPVFREFFPLYILYLSSMILIYRINKKMAITLLIPVIFFGNYISLFTFGQIISQSVYHRIYLFNMIGIVSLLGIVLFIDRYLSKVYLWFPLLILLFIFGSDNYFDRITIYNYRNSKINNSNVLILEQFDFSKSKVLDTNTVEKSETEDGIFQIFQLRPELYYEDVCKQGCYEVINRAQLLDYEVELDLTDDKVLIYRK